MTRTTTILNGYTAWLELDGSLLTASYEEADALLAEITYIVHKRERIDGIWRHEETDIDQDAYAHYFDTLVAWVAEETGYDPEELAEAFHPDVPEPCIRYRITA